MIWYLFEKLRVTNLFKIFLFCTPQRTTAVFLTACHLTLTKGTESSLHLYTLGHIPVCFMSNKLSLSLSCTDLTVARVISHALRVGRAPSILSLVPPSQQ